MHLIGLVLALGVIVLAMGDVATFVDLPSAIIVLVFSIGALVFARAGLPTMLRAPFSASASSADLLVASRGWAQARVYLLAGGVIGTLVGWIIMLKNMDSTEALAPGTALSLLTILYALALAYGVCMPVQKRLEDRARGEQD